MKCTWQFVTALLFLLVTYIPSFAQGDKNNVVVLPKSMPAPEGAKKIGSFTFGNNSTHTHCDYEGDINAAKIKARKMGGNILKITELITPAFIGKCYRIKADVYYGNTSPYAALRTTEKQYSPADTVPHATLYIYRLRDTTAFAMGYDLHLDNDSVICRMKSKTHRVAYLYKQGSINLWGKMESKKSVTINVKFGQTYYLRCGTEHGEVLGVPVLQLVDAQTGAAEYNKLLKSKKDDGAHYLNEVH